MLQNKAELKWDLRKEDIKCHYLNLTIATLTIRLHDKHTRLQEPNG